MKSRQWRAGGRGNDAGLRAAGDARGSLGTLHASTFYFDQNVQHMISLCYLMAYEGGQVQPGDDMAGSRFRWWSLEELADESVKIIVPPDQKWLVRRAVELYGLWKGQDVELEPEPSLAARNKHAL